MLRTHLWKEWREQRVFVWITSAVLGVLAVAYGALAPKAYMPQDAHTWFVVIALSAGFVALVGDLVPGEFRRRQLTFLLRCPHGLRRAWLAKMITMAGCFGLLGVVGVACGEVCTRVAGVDPNEHHRALGPVHVWTQVSVIWLGIGVAAPWGFAVSCWVSRAASVVPAAALACAALVAPAVLVMACYGVPVDDRTVGWCAATLFVGGVATAWLSFVRGLRFGSHFQAFVRGIPGLLVVLVPLSAWSIERAWTYYHASSCLEEVVVSEAFLGDDGRDVYLTLWRGWGQDGPTYTVVVDGETGAMRQIGGPGARWCEGISYRDQAGRTAAPMRFLFHYPGERRESRIFDTRDGSVHDLDASGAFPRHLRAAVAEDSKARRSFVLPGGARCWLANREIVYEEADGSSSVVEWPTGSWASSMPGFGMGFMWITENGFRHQGFDLVRRRTFALPDSVKLSSLTMASGGWSWRSDEELVLFDPETREETSWRAPDGAQELGVSPTGWVFVRDDGSLSIVDPFRGAEHRVEVLGEDVSRIGRVARLWEGSAVRASDEGVLLRVALETAPGERFDWTVGRLSGRVLRLGPRERWGFQVVADLPTGEVMVLVDQRRLELWRPGTTEREVVFRLDAP